MSWSYWPFMVIMMRQLNVVFWQFQSGLFGMSIWSIWWSSSVCAVVSLMLELGSIHHLFLFLLLISSVSYEDCTWIYDMILYSKVIQSITVCPLGVCSFWWWLVGWQNAYQVPEHRVLMAQKRLCSKSSRKTTCIHSSSYINVDSSMLDIDLNYDHFYETMLVNQVRVCLKTHNEILSENHCEFYPHLTHLEHFPARKIAILMILATDSPQLLVCWLHLNTFLGFE